LELYSTTLSLSLDLSLLQSDPPDGTKLRKANALCLAAVESAEDLPMLAKRYISRLTRALEVMCTKNTTLSIENAKQRETLQSRKKQTTGKRVALQGKFMFSIQEVLEVARQVEIATADKTSRKRCCTQPVVVETEDQEIQLLENVSSDSDSDCIVVRPRRMELKVVD